MCLTSRHCLLASGPHQAGQREGAQECASEINRTNTPQAQGPGGKLSSHPKSLFAAAFLQDCSEARD